MNFNNINSSLAQTGNHNVTVTVTVIDREKRKVFTHVMSFAQIER
jgi:hypothetical protein